MKQKGFGAAGRWAAAIFVWAMAVGVSGCGGAERGEGCELDSDCAGELECLKSVIGCDRWVCSYDEYDYGACDAGDGGSGNSTVFTCDGSDTAVAQCVVYEGAASDIAGIKSQCQYPFTGFDGRNCDTGQPCCKHTNGGLTSYTYGANQQGYSCSSTNGTDCSGGSSSSACDGFSTKFSGSSSIGKSCKPVSIFTKKKCYKESGTGYAAMAYCDRSSCTWVKDGYVSSKPECGDCSGDQGIIIISCLD